MKCWGSRRVFDKFGKLSLPVPGVGLEPTRGCPHEILSSAQPREQDDIGLH